MMMEKVRQTKISSFVLKIMVNVLPYVLNLVWQPKPVWQIVHASRTIRLVCIVSFAVHHNEFLANCLNSTALRPTY